MKKITTFPKKILALRRRTKIIGLIIILIALFLLFRGRGKEAPLQFASAKNADIASTVTASGILSGKKVAVLHFNQGGKLNYLPAANGDTVVAGQVLASLDATQFNSALQEVWNTRRSTEANVELVHDQVKGHDGDETFAQKTARTAAEVANDNAYAAVLAAQKAVNDAVLRSPFSGIIVAQDNISVGQNIGVSDLVAKLVDFSQKDFDATVDESDIGTIQIGQDAKVTLNTYGDAVFTGKVVEIDSQTKTDTTGSITILVKIQVDDPKIAPIYGLNGQADIIIQSKKNVLTIPQDALIDDTHVYVKLPNGKTEKREIVSGIKSDIDVEVISGLTEGTEVITNPASLSTK